MHGRFILLTVRIEKDEAAAAVLIDTHDGNTSVVISRREVNENVL